MPDITMINETDILLVRRMATAARDLNRYSDASITESKLLASLLSERFDVSAALVVSLSEVA